MAKHYKIVLNKKKKQENTNKRAKTCCPPLEGAKSIVVLAFQDKMDHSI